MIHARTRKRYIINDNYKYFFKSVVIFPSCLELVQKPFEHEVFIDFKYTFDVDDISIYLVCDLSEFLSCYVALQSCSFKLVSFFHKH